VGRLARAVCFATHDDDSPESQDSVVRRPSNGCRQSVLLLAAEMVKYDCLKQVNSRTVPAAARFDS
jgi:hypothetical protein